MHTTPLQAKDPLKPELEFFEAHKAEFLRAYGGQFALIKDRQLIGTFTTELDAYREGVRRFGNTPLLIKRVVPDEPPAAHPALVAGLH